MTLQEILDFEKLLQDRIKSLMKSMKHGNPDLFGIFSGTYELNIRIYQEVKIRKRYLLIASGAAH